MKIKLSIIFLSLSLCSSLICCSQRTEIDSAVGGEVSSVILDTTEDMGEKYIDSLIFFGESTTYHLKSRGVLKNGTNTTQVWANKSGTANLDFTTKDLKIIYPETNETMTVAEAAGRAHPDYIVMCFGLNGAVQKINKGKDYFKGAYLRLIKSVIESSPETKIILQSAFPIAFSMDTSSFGVDAATLNSYIDKINSWTLELAFENGLRYLNTAEILKDKNNALLPEYDTGDGHHLNTEAYKKILTYIRTHGYR